MGESITGSRDKANDSGSQQTIRIRIYGIVQGVGFRPAVARHAAAAGARGTVVNKGPYVEIIAQGTEAVLRAFVRLVREEPPARAVVLRMETTPLPDAEQTWPTFSIIDSVRTGGEIYIPPDLALCDDCRRELLDPRNRRYLHPFINCTQCGPRLTILEGLPYDRERTSMKRFPMCPACSREYHDPHSRRYDAQPVCCPDCGPEVYLLDQDGKPGVRGHEAIAAIRRILANGGIAAVKGIGGFHLCCDAADPAAVARLRERKHRPAKPFAVMLRDEAAARRECRVDSSQYRILTGHQKPILLLPKRTEGTRICSAVAPDNPFLGVMLPYAPIQVLLFCYDDGVAVSDALVMTSGNVQGAPIARDDAEAVSMLGGVCDGILSNNRPILLRADDSVVDFYEDAPYMVRRSRGYAPLPVPVTLPAGPAPGTVLGIGGELKNTFCLSRNDLFYPSSYIGDLADVRAHKALEEAVERMCVLLETGPQLIVCDAHPRYQSAAIARKLGERYSAPVLPLQHHYAHVLSCMAENDWSKSCIGIALDGTGYGENQAVETRRENAARLAGERAGRKPVRGTVWGGELLLTDPSGFVRAASIRPFLQTGGDAAVREGWRIAVSLVRAVSSTREEALERIRVLDLCTPADAGLLLTTQEAGVNTVESTSAGRLFDAVSAILGIRRRSTFEGEASTTLMYRAMDGRKLLQDENRWQRYARPLLDQAAVLRPQKAPDGRWLVPTEGLFRLLLREKLRGAGRPQAAARNGAPAGREEPAGAATYRREQDAVLAYIFHEALARMLADCAALLREEGAPSVCALSGGCYQNRLLLELSQKALEEKDFKVLRHHLIPPNDGGIALGQAFAGSVLLRRNVL